MRYNWKEVLKNNPNLKRKMICDGTITTMAREGIDVNKEMVYYIYDNYQSKGLKLPDGFLFSLTTLKKEL